LSEPAEPGVFARKRTIEPRHIDALGHVNNVVWVDFIVRLADAHSSSLGFDQQRVRALGGQWIVRRHEIDYHASAAAGDEILEETWVEEMRGARSVRCARFTRRTDRALLVESATQWAYCDPRTLRPTRIHPEILAAFESTRRGS
jgi:acyl-CoA thioester hydrolase